jgi:hypothetical protein
LVQASCSSRVETAEFFQTIHKTALKEKRPLREIERTGHPVDHPVGFPEGEYLKCLFAVMLSGWYYSLIPELGVQLFQQLGGFDQFIQRIFLANKIAVVGRHQVQRVD